jgi:hypothetical protein
MPAFRLLHEIVLTEWASSVNEWSRSDPTGRAGCRLGDANLASAARDMDSRQRSRQSPRI